MSLRKWFGTEIKQEPEQPERRSDARLSVHTEVLVDDGNSPGAEELKRANLIDFASGGIRLLLDSAVEIGQTVWVRTRVTHVSRTALNTELGVTWDANRPIDAVTPDSAAREGAGDSPNGDSE